MSAGPTAQELHLQVQARLIEELSEKQHAFQTHLDLLEEIVFRCDREGQLILLNQAWQRKLNYSLDQCLGKSMHEFFAYDAQWSALQQKMRNSDHVSDEVGLRCSNDDIRTFTLSVRRRGDEWYGSLHDVSELRLTVNALKLSEEKTRKLSLVASRTDNLVVITDAAGRIDWVNEAFVKSSGHGLADVRGKKPGAILQGPLTDKATVQMMSDRLQGGQGFQAEVINYTMAGKPYWVAIDCTPVTDESGAISHFIAIEREISDRKRVESALKESERRFRQILESVSEAIFLCTDELRLTFVNPAWCQFTAQDQISSLNHKLWDFIHPSDHPLVVDALRSLEGVEVESVRVEVRAKAKHAEWRRAELVLSQSSGFQGNDHGFTGALIDVDERWQITQATVEAKQRAEELSHARTRFVANMSHEIRTPLNAIIGMTSVLEATELSPEQSLCVDTILSGSRALLSLVNDILDVAKIDSGAIELEEQAFSIADVCDEAADLIAASVQEKGLLLTHYIEPDVPHYFLGDAHRLRQVIINLLSNAVKFTSSGSVDVAVGWRPKEPGQGALLVEVRDTGAGIPPERLATLFDAFTQADSSITREFGGTGLGLTICQQICELMGGSIKASSQLGEGARFSFEVCLQVERRKRRPTLEGSIVATNLNPRWQRVAKSLAQINGCDFRIVEGADNKPSLLWSNGKGYEAAIDAEPQCSVLTPSRVEKIFTREHMPQKMKDLSVQACEKNSNCRILIAEDVIANQIVISAMLKQLGFHAFVMVDDGQKAVDRARTEVFDIIILDVHMPVLDGISAARQIVKDARDPAPRILAASADVTLELRRSAKDAGITGWISKPFVREQLGQLLQANASSMDAWI